MFRKRLEGEVTYIQSKDNYFIEEIALGSLVRSMGHPLKIGIISFNSDFSKIITFLENLCISQKFKKIYQRLHVETFTIRDKKVQRGLLPNVEFQTIPYDSLLSTLYSFEHLIFINPSDELLFSEKFKFFLKEKQEETEIIILHHQSQPKNLLDLVDSSYQLTISKTSLLEQKNNIILLLNSAFTELLAYGYLIRKYLDKKQVKIISFDKGDPIYGEMFFYRGLKTFSKEYPFYGEFDYCFTGSPRIKGRDLRSLNTNLDLREAQDALMLAKTSLKKQTPVVIDNIETSYHFKALELQDIMSLFSGTINEVLVPLRKESNLSNQLSSISKVIVEFKVLKYANSDKMRKGFNY